MANQNIVKTSAHRTGQLRVIEGDGVKRQPLDLANLTIPQLRALLGKVHGVAISDGDAERVIKMVQGMADKQATAPVPKGAVAEPDFELGWDVKKVSAAVRVVVRALPAVAEWYAGLPTTDQIEKTRAVLAQLAGPLPALFPAVRFPLGEKFKPSRQPKECLWHLPAVMLANTLDRMVRLPGDTELPKFSRGSSLTRAIYTIIAALKFAKPPRDPSAVSSHLESWWADKNHPRLPLGVASGRELLRPAVLRQAETPEAAAALGHAADALEEVQRLLRERQKGE